MAAAAVSTNPSLVVEHQRTLDGATEHETVVGASLALSVSGRRSLLVDAAAAHSDGADWRASARLFEAALAFREAYVAAVVEARRFEVLSEHQARLEALGTVIQRLSERGEAAGYDLSRQQVQARMHKTALERARARARASTVTLQAWMGADVMPANVAVESLAGGALVSARFASSASTAPPQVRALEADGRASELRARAARRRRVPDLELFAGYRTITTGNETGRGISVAVSVPLTIFDHGQGDAAQADAEGDLARAVANVERREQLSRARAAFAELAMLSAAVGEAEQAVTEATAVQERATKLYAAGEVTLAELFDAYGGAEEARLQRIELAQQIASLRLAVMRSTGTFFDSALDRACQTPAGVQP